MSFKWRVNTTLTPKLAEKYIKSQGWNLQIDTINYFGQGWDNIAFLVNDKIVFRFAKTDEASILIKQENLVLPHLQNLSLQVPNPIYIGRPNENNPYHFHGYEKLSGIPAYQIKLSDDNLKSCLEQLAFLKELHSFKRNSAQKLGAMPVVYDRTKVNIVIKSLQERLQKLHELKIIQFNQSFIKQQIQGVQKISLNDTEHCLVHGDLDTRHLLVLDNKLSGIIDWGDVGIGHPVTDLAIIFGWFPVEMHDLFFKIYGPVSQDVQTYARFLALHRAITLMWYGHGIDDQIMLEVSLKAYEELRKH